METGSPGTGTCGAVYSPACVMVPTTLFPPVAPFTVQVTVRFAGMVVPVNCWVAPAASVTRSR